MEHKDDFSFISTCKDVGLSDANKISIKVFGVGGAGGNAVNRMIEAGLKGVDFVAVNTDFQDLEKSLAPVKLQIGQRDSRGLGTGGDPERGQKAALDDTEAILKQMEDTDLIFITAGMGGGTGTGAAPVIASLAAAQTNAITVAVVTKPFECEGRKRGDNAALGLDQLSEAAATLIVIPNDKLLATLPEDISLEGAFKTADDVLRQGVQGISDLIAFPGLINLDFQDVRSVLSSGGFAIMGMGSASGADRCMTATQQAANNPLLEDSSMEGAGKVLLHLAGGSKDSIKLHEFQSALDFMNEQAHQAIELIAGTSIDTNLDDDIRVTVVASAFDRTVGSTAKRAGAMKSRPTNTNAGAFGVKQASEAPFKKPVGAIPGGYLRGKLDSDGLFAAAEEFNPTPDSKDEKDYETYQTPSYIRNKKRRD